MEKRVLVAGRLQGPFSANLFVAPDNEPIGYVWERTGPARTDVICIGEFDPSEGLPR